MQPIIPEIRINFAYLLYNGESQTLAGGSKLEGEASYQKMVDSYRGAWQQFGEAILEALQTVLGVTFYRSVIDVNCAPFFIPKSEPLIINFRNQPDQFIDVLTHELCHILLTDNNKIQINASQQPFDLIEKWSQLFGTDHDFSTSVHIPVHALLKYVYIDVLDAPYRLERDIKDVASFDEAKAYVDAWDYVQSNDYMQIIAELKTQYAEVLS